MLAFFQELVGDNQISSGWGHYKLIFFFLTVFSLLNLTPTVEKLVNGIPHYLSTWLEGSSSSDGSWGLNCEGHIFLHAVNLGEVLSTGNSSSLVYRQDRIDGKLTAHIHSCWVLCSTTGGQVSTVRTRLWSAFADWALGTMTAGPSWVAHSSHHQGCRSRKEGTVSLPRLRTTVPVPHTPQDTFCFSFKDG